MQYNLNLSIMKQNYQTCLKINLLNKPDSHPSIISRFSQKFHLSQLSQLSHYAHSSPISDGMHGVATSGETKKPRGRKP